MPEQVRPVAERVLAAARTLCEELAGFRCAPPVTHIYNPLEYAAEAYKRYVRTYGATKKRALFLGMNPGPFGMAQTGVPFGEIAAVRDWMKITANIGKPQREHPRRPITGFACERAEVSGARLWGLFAERFETADRFFAEHFVLNYCPLVFMDEGGRNLTPDKLPIGESRALFLACDEHLRAQVLAFEPQWVLGIGKFAARRASLALGDAFPGTRVGEVLHPSPASPAANRGWAAQATRALESLGVW